MLQFIKPIIIQLGLILALAVPLQGITAAQEKTTVAVLPFKIHSLEPLDYLKQGLQEMFTTRLSDKGIDAINPETVNKNPMAFLPLFESDDFYNLGKKLGADWLLAGSLTQVGKKISLDLKVVDVKGERPPFSVFIVEDSMDRLADASERATSSIYNQISGVVQIDSIYVRGNKRIESEAVLAVIASRKGDQFNNETLDTDLRTIYKMGFFKEVNIETEDGAGGKIVIINVIEKPSITKISVVGSKKYDEKELKEECGIKPYTIVSRSQIRQSVNRLEEFYRQKGYYNIQVKEKLEELPNNEVSLVYEVDEGSKVYISKIEFEGNTKFDDGDLRKIMETSQKTLISFITGSGLLDKKKLEFDVQKVTAFYHNHGYIKVQVGEPKVAFEKGKGLTITIDVIEGPVYGVNNVRIVGAREEDMILTEDELVGFLKITKEEFFNREAIRQDSITLRGFYADEGYAYADVSPMTSQDDENHLVDITYTISKGKKVRFERINITGNNVTRDKVIRRELRVNEGDYFSARQLKKSTSNLHRLGFFEDVQIKPTKGSQDDLMVLDIDVKERATGQFSIGAGFSTYDKVIGMFQISQNNLFGYGQRLEANGRIGSRTMEFDIRFTEPWFLDKPITFGADIHNWRREYDEYTQDSFGGAIRFGTLLGLDEYTRGWFRYTYVNTNLSDIDDDASLSIKEQEGDRLKSSITLGVGRDTKDRPFHTTRGSANSASFEYAGGILGGQSDFNKVLASSAWYFPLKWNTVFLARGNLGYADEREAGGLPIFEKFRIGGINTVRGWEFGTISPVDPITGDYVGGEWMMYYNFEYRFPLIKEQGVVGLVFFDAGNVWTSVDAFEVSSIRTSIGGGIRWYSPVGPIRVEYGKKLDPLEGESSGEFEFAMGGAF